MEMDRIENRDQLDQLATAALSVWWKLSSAFISEL
jgi:hypothetical protein